MKSGTPYSFQKIPNRLLSVERQVAIAVRRLATGDQMLGIGELFGVSKQTVSKVTTKFIMAMAKKAGHHIQWPEGEAMVKTKQGFEWIWGFPNCCGAIDATHFLIELPPVAQSAAYYDYKRKMSVSMQAIVDVNLKFLDVFAGWPGSIHDSRLLINSGFFRDVQWKRTKLNGPEVTLHGGSTIGEYIVGDGGYPCFPWLVTSFPLNSGHRRNFSYFHSSTQMPVERAFGRLKGVWRILSRIMYRPNKQRLGSLIYTCCLLHNIMIDKKDEIQNGLLTGIQPHPTGYGTVSTPMRASYNGGLQKRLALMNHVFVVQKNKQRSPSLA